MPITNIKSVRLLQIANLECQDDGIILNANYDDSAVYIHTENILDKSVEEIQNIIVRLNACNTASPVILEYAGFNITDALFNATREIQSQLKHFMTLLVSTASSPIRYADGIFNLNTNNIYSVKCKSRHYNILKDGLVRIDDTPLMYISELREFINLLDMFPQATLEYKGMLFNTKSTLISMYGGKGFSLQDVYEAEIARGKYIDHIGDTPDDILDNAKRLKVVLKYTTDAETLPLKRMLDLYNSDNDLYYVWEHLSFSQYSAIIGGILYSIQRDFSLIRIDDNTIVDFEQLTSELTK